MITSEGPIERTSSALPIAPWQQLGQRLDDITDVDVLQDEKRRSVYRLRLRTESGSLVLKRCPTDQALREIMFYGDVLPRLGLPRVALHGSSTGDHEGETWILMADAGESLFDVGDPGHRRLAASWLARFQLAGASVDLSDLTLRDRGPRHFEQHVHVGRRALEDAVSHPALTSEDEALVVSLRDAVRAVEERWAALIAECDGYPSTLVHGDFKPDNLRIWTDGSNQDLIVFDWNEGGTGLPALDLSRFLRSEPSMLRGAASGETTAAEIEQWVHLLAPDLDVYMASIEPLWPSVSAEGIRRIGLIGEVFRCMASVRWQAARLEYADIVSPLSHLAYFDEWLAHLLLLMGWD